MCLNRTAFFRGLSFTCSFKPHVCVGDVDGASREENHGTRTLSDDNEQSLRGVDSVLDVIVDNEADLAEWSDTMEWLIDDDDAVFGVFSEGCKGDDFRFEDAEVGREGGSEIECVECRVGCAECCAEPKGRICGVREM